MHILLVDDEALARQRLRTLLADCQAQQPGLRLHVQEAAHAAQALALLQAPGGQAIDLLLLDIHMPGQDGLALAQCLQRLPQAPALVFVTAHAEHAVSAFELDAVDYLTKPVRLPRLQQALAKVQRLRGLGHTLGAGAAQPTAHPTVPTEAPAHEAEALCIQERGRTERVPLTELLYIKAEQKYLTVRTLQRTYILDGALNDLQARYSSQLLRIHRNALVARHAVRALEKHYDKQPGSTEADTWAVRLHGCTELLSVSRRQLAAVRALLAQA